MNEKKDRTILVVSIIVVVGLLVGMTGGCLGGGLAGYLLARCQIGPLEQRLEDLESNSILRLPELLPDVDQLLPELLRRFRELDPSQRQEFFERFQELPPEMQDWFDGFPEFDPEGLPDFFDEFGWPEMPEGVQGGALIQEVIADSPAEQAGLEVGDLITAIDGQTVDEAHPLQEIIAGYMPGDGVMISYVRDGRQLKRLVRLGVHPDDARRPYLGVYFVAVSLQERFELPSEPNQPSG